MDCGARGCVSKKLVAPARSQNESPDSWRSALLSFFHRVFSFAPASASLPVRVDSGETVDCDDVFALTAAWACVRFWADNIASLPLLPFVDLGNGHKRVAAEHPLYRLLRRAPNAEQTVVDFWAGGVTSLELKGNLVALKQRGASGSLIGLAPMPWDWTKVTRPTKGGPLAYEFDGKTYGPEDVLHIRGFGGAPEGGLSTIAHCAAAFGNAKAVNRTAGKIFANSARPSGVITSDLPLDEQQTAEVRDTLERRFVGAQNAGRPLVLSNGLKWQQITLNPEDAQLLESRKFSGEEVCRIFGVPPAMVGYGDKASNWGTGKEVDVLGLQKFGLRPRLKRIETALEQQLLTAEDIARGVSIEFVVEGILRGDSEGRAGFYREMSQIGAMTINEIRAKEGLPPVAGGDVPRMQSQNVPITQAAGPAKE